MDAGAGRIAGTAGQTIVEALVEAENLLRSARVTDVPRLEAEVLLADLLGVERAELIASYALDMLRGDDYSSRIARRLAGEPVAYITGRKEFMGLTFATDARALIPRPETELLIECALEAARAGDVSIIADIGAGCGCVAVSLATLLPEAEVYATDISPDALALARLNAERHGVGGRVDFQAGDVFAALPLSLRGRIDVIVSNPPYVSDAEYVSLENGIRAFEPSIALRGGVDGLDVFREIAFGAADFLSPGGFMAIEIGAGQGGAAAEILEGTGDFFEIDVLRDPAGHTRVITCQSARKPGKTKPR